MQAAQMMADAQPDAAAAAATQHEQKVADCVTMKGAEAHDAALAYGASDKERGAPNGTSGNKSNTLGSSGGCRREDNELFPGRMNDPSFKLDFSFFPFPK